MNIGKKIWKIAIAALLLAPLFAGSLKASAVTTPETADVTVHKRVFENNLPPANKANTGEVMNDFGGVPLADAGFTVYDVSEMYNTEIRKPGATQATVQAAIIAKYEAAPTVPHGFNIAKAEQKTAEGTGETKFVGLPITTTVGTAPDVKTIDAAYLIVETSVPLNPVISTRAVPMVIAMPIVRPGTTTVNKDIHVYPKNVTQRDDKKEFVNEKDYTVTINGETFNSAQIGDKFNYKIKVNMPDISKLESFKVIDEPGLGMDMAEPNNLTLPGLTINVDYTVDYDATASGRGFAITFNNTEAVRKLAGKVLPITYTMVLTANAPIDTPINNNAHIEVNGETTTEFTPPNPVYTHGKQFKKVNAKTGEELSGAEFKVKKGSLFAKFTSDQVDGKTVYTLNGWDATGTVVTSGTDGIIRIKGMKVGDYNLIETKAPTGYILESSDIAFTIVKDQYGNAAHIQTVNNLRQGLLPSTGGTGIYAFLIIGSMMMAGAYFWFKRSKEHAEV